MTAENSPITLSLAHGEGNPRNSEGAFVTLADGRILFVWSRYRGDSWADHARADLAARYSADGGATWSPRDRILIENEGDQNVMSVSLLRLQDGRLAMFYLRKNSNRDCRPMLRTSPDEGESWTEATPCSTFVDYFCLLNDQARQLKSGRIVLPVSRHERITEPGTTSSIVFFLSDDAGRSWRRSQAGWKPHVGREAHVAEPGVVELADGRLYCYARTALGRQWQSTSTDQGETWSPPQPSPFWSPRAPMNIKRLPRTGDLLAVWNDPTPRWGVEAKPLADGWAHGDSSWGRTPLVLALSSDEGATWHDEQAIETDPDRGFCYTAIHGTDEAVLLAYCCGGRGGAVLQDLCIRRVPLACLKAAAPR